MTGGEILRDARIETFGQHSKRRIARDAHDVLLPDPQRNRGLFDVRVRVFGNVDAQARKVAPAHPAFANA